MGGHLKLRRTKCRLCCRGRDLSVGRYPGEYPENAGRRGLGSTES